jgi:hypothetical protein
VDKKRQARIDELLRYSSKGYHRVDNCYYQPHDITYQKVELLFRNKAFLSDLAKLNEYFSAGQHPRPYPGEGKWFFDKWQISTAWKRSKQHLTFSLKAGPAIFVLYDRPTLDRLFAQADHELPPFVKYGDRWVRIIGNGYEHFAQLEYADHWPPRLSIAVDPWTTKEQIGELSSMLPQLKRDLFGFALESKANFARDLCWYDLHHELRLGTSEIARIWAAKKPREFRALAENSAGWKDGNARGEKITAELAKGDARFYIEDYIKQQLPAVISSAINRIQLAVNYLTR